MSKGPNAKSLGLFFFHICVVHHLTDAYGPQDGSRYKTGNLLPNSEGTTPMGAKMQKCVQLSTR